VFCLAEVMPVVQDRFGQARATVLAQIAALTAEAEKDHKPVPAEPAPAPTTVASFEADFERSPAPPSPGLPPVAISTSTSEPTPPVHLSRPKLPAPMLQQIETRAAELADAGRVITPADVQAVINLPAAMAEQTAKYYAAANAPA
jgi:hypothetical protein